MKNIEKLNAKLLLIPNTVAFFGLVFATDAKNLLAVAYCVIVFLFITLLHLIECFRLNKHTREAMEYINLIFYLVSLFIHNWLLFGITLIILAYLRLTNYYLYKSKN